MQIVDTIRPVPRNNLLALAQSFPTLRDVPEQFFAPRFNGREIGFASHGAEHFAQWVREQGGAGMRDAGLFVLSVWNTSTDWGEVCGLRRDDGPTGGRFDPHRALGNWDPGHRAAFVAWAVAPWWL